MSSNKDLLKILQLCIRNTGNREVLDEIGITPDLLALSSVHHISPMVYDQIGKTDAFLSLPEEEREKYKKQAVSLMSNQTMRTICFLQLKREMLREGLDPIIVKGIVIRKLYPKPDFRVSADEDLIISEAEFFRMDRFLKDRGYTTDYEGKEVPYEAGYRNLRTEVYLEIHTSLFEKEHEVFSAYNRVLEGYEDRTIHVSVDGTEIRTLSDGDHLVYLIAHFAKHFRYSGAGIRQILDIIVFTEKRFESIDFDTVFNQLSEIGLYELTDSIYDIGEKYLGFSRKECGMKEKEYNPDHEELLKDILEGGVYGRATTERLHSSNITLAENEKKGILKALFPSKEYMENQYPYVKNSPFGLPIAYAERIIRYIADNEDISGTVRKGKERSRLIQTYIDPEVRYDTAAYMENVREVLGRDREVIIPVAGNSMVPFLVNGRDSVVVRRPDRPLRPGDIILYQRTNGRYILHRIVGIRGNRYITAGDNEDVTEKNLRLSQVLGYVVRVSRKGKWIDHTDPVWRFFSDVWPKLVPIHTHIIRLYSLFYRQ